ncbi:uncharacterized protein FTJAE_3485 [Fusarium tjaetaba]|uniref:Uncharacterized protein n=1 Tax=Fusarium tjaetaba TaxID=1567544 RepID=A0A8H5W2R3_9HYPO|nr:uncharacterized protein FTJAE_3485 [Fusarium tjaetaba]KAF5642769.1 hypothetical protein FTJAE_3485 [Fusarium tjaetaba]
MPYLNQYSPIYSCPGVGSIRAAKRLGNTLAKVDGVFAAFTHLNITEPVSRARRSSSRLDDIVLGLDSLCNTSLANSASHPQPDFTDPRNQARDNAWASIRTVGEGAQVLWGNFVDVSHNVKLPAINNIRTEYHDAQGLRQAGQIQRLVSGPGEDTWIECLGDLGKYRMAIEDDDIRDRVSIQDQYKPPTSTSMQSRVSYATPSPNAGGPIAASSTHDSHSRPLSSTPIDGTLVTLQQTPVFTAALEYM